jgi:hypothetical protein
LAYQSFGVQGCNAVFEETNDAQNFLMAPNHDLLANHKYNTEHGQHCVACFSSFCLIGGSRRCIKIQMSHGQRELKELTQNIVLLTLPNCRNGANIEDLHNRAM